MSQTQKQNRLAQESSPYLLQHADNPVDWWPWGPQALQKAKQENKLILLSVGYSACHWCHVMAHESFEDPDTAAVMNQHYINIKVDREERPDLDKIYQTAHQLLNQRAGGWPLTMILSPDQHIPIFAGTYFPVTEKHGLPAFKDLLKHIDEFYQAHPDDIQQQNQSLMDALDAISQPNSEPGTPSSLPLDQARQQLAQQFDNTHAGFGKAPKFPHPSNLAFLLRYWLTSNANQNPDQQSLHMLRMSLHAMASGGIYDQLGGGFFRYAVDDYWMIPHFEKMLYDNGPLVSLYAQAYKTIGDSVFARIAQDTCQWVIDEMQSPQGGYYSTLDADAEGHEGKFYVWNKAEVQSLLDEPSFALFSKLFGFDRAANFEGQWHLHLYESLDTVATELGIDMDTAASQLQQAQQQLLAKRAQRIRPSRDEKILTSWNGLMIKGMAQAGHLLSQPQFIASAQQAVDFIQQHMVEDNRLFATYKDSQARLMAYLDDYAFLLDAALHLLQAAWQERHLQFAIALADTLLTHFEDTEQGGFYFTAHDHEQLIQRAVLLGNLPQARQETRIRNNKARVTHHRLQNHPRNFIGILGKQFLHRFQIVVGRGQGVLGHGLRHPRGIRQSQGCHPGPRLHQEHIPMAVVATLKLQQAIALSIGPHQALHRQTSLRPRIHKADHLNTGNRIDHHLSQHIFQRTGRPKTSPLSQGIRQGRQHFVISMATDCRTPSADIIDIAIIIHIPGIGPLHPIKHDRLPPDRFERPHRGINATGHQLLGSVKNSF